MIYSGTCELFVVGKENRAVETASTQTKPASAG